MNFIETGKEDKKVEIAKIVITGGPCAGKTTALARIEQDLSEKGYHVFIVGESATELIKGGICCAKKNYYCDYSNFNFHTDLYFLKYSCFSNSDCIIKCCSSI